MKFVRYKSMEEFGTEVSGILLENEVQNNLPLSFIKNENNWNTSEWLMASVKDENGSVVLTAACTPPHNIVMYETRNKPNDEAIKLLSDELKSIGFRVPGVLAEQGLARRFAEIYTARFHCHVSMNIMKLEKLNDMPKTPGFCREICEKDLFYLPYWIKAFGEDCNVLVDSSVEHLQNKIGTKSFYIWENEHPVSCAANNRNTENGAGIGYVYTPPHYRGKGYASSVVAELAGDLLARGNKFCFLFADAKNPVSCRIYRKIGFYDICIFDEIRFGDGNGN
jgi:hypothetical protein